MTRDETIQALRCCSVHDCIGCPTNRIVAESCTAQVLESAANLLEADEKQLEVAASSMQGVLRNLEKINQALDNGTDTNVGAKTADEMFRESGYEKERDNKVQTVYINCENEIIFAKNQETVFSINGNGEANGLTYEELRAVCKLLDEMGV